MNGIRQIHERDLWMSHQGDQLGGVSATWNVVDDQTVETSRTLHAVRCAAFFDTLARKFLLLFLLDDQITSSLHCGDGSNER